LSTLASWVIAVIDVPIWNIPSIATRVQPSAAIAVIQETYRLFNCARCSRQAKICGRCDRANIYCSQECSAAGRSDSLRRAGARYQRTFAGADNHARRQQQYVIRRRAKMTHQGSPPETPPATVEPAAPEIATSDPAPDRPSRPEVGGIAAPAPGRTSQEAFRASTSFRVTAMSTQQGVPTCDFCGQRCPPFARRDHHRCRGRPGRPCPHRRLRSAWRTRGR